LALLALLAAAPTASAAGVGDPESATICQYAKTEAQYGSGPWLAAELRRIAITPPVIYASSGTQTFGWKFSIVRRSPIDPPEGSYTYHSSWQDRTATKTQRAAFTQRGVDISLPQTVTPQQVRYSVILLIGRVENGKHNAGAGGTEEYRVAVDGKLQWKTSEYLGCRGEVVR
jgi:hypothetical protein